MIFLYQLFLPVDFVGLLIVHGLLIYIYYEELVEPVEALRREIIVVPSPNRSQLSITHYQKILIEHHQLIFCGIDWFGLVVESACGHFVLYISVYDQFLDSLSRPTRTITGLCILG